jgi:hypothetical protein
MCAKPQPEDGRSYFGDLTGGIKFCSKLPTQKKQQPSYQKLIIKHSSLKKLSLWGCSAIEVSVQMLYTIVNASLFWFMHIVKPVCSIPLSWVTGPVCELPGAG